MPFMDAVTERAEEPRARYSRSRRPRYIGNEIFRRSSYGLRHPLAIPRVSTCTDLCRALGWLPEGSYLDGPLATPQQLARFHHPDYVAALQQAECQQSISDEMRTRFNIGRSGNPLFHEIYSRPATACGSSLLAAALLLASDGPRLIYSPAGGTHHGRPGRASGFCYLNDPALAILALLDGGLDRVLYIDVDAHHGDGVQDAFAEDERVLTLSLHEAGRWPLRADSTAGTLHDRAGGMARNLPVPPGFNDSELAFLLEAAILPLAEVFAPQAVVLQCGADALADDPQSRLMLSNRALWQVAAAALHMAPRARVLGGGGYNPWSVGRCWAGVWATLNGHDIPERLPAPAEAILRALTWRHSRGRQPPEHWFTSLADPPRPGLVRTGIRDMATAVLAP